ncbi:uncharacterized protein N7483_007114 [Penicillium malachiteum]|uniref:uncharacterized protein n=1 Tax=Penicillium malachiteum TaxID=1324776 RepID=UPI0025483CDD|nr:uncharacterized protein N7483_007114 [Penicillium malachiteum]KAJ5725757.1 hypothetical protein N7483_007114 [Penicillium malachiteum]
MPGSSLGLRKSDEIRIDHIRTYLASLALAFSFFIDRNDHRDHAIATRSDPREVIKSMQKEQTP